MKITPVFFKNAYPNRSSYTFSIIENSFGRGGRGRGLRLLPPVEAEAPKPRLSRFARSPRLWMTSGFSKRRPLGAADSMTGIDLVKEKSRHRLDNWDPRGRSGPLGPRQGLINRATSARGASRPSLRLPWSRKFFRLPPRRDSRAHAGHCPLLPGRCVAHGSEAPRRVHTTRRVQCGRADACCGPRPGGDYLRVVCHQAVPLTPAVNSASQRRFS